MDQETIRILITAISTFLASALTAVVAVTLTQRNHKQDHMKWLRAEKVKSYATVQEEFRRLTNQVGKCLLHGGSTHWQAYRKLIKNFNSEAFSLVASEEVRDAADALITDLQSVYRWSIQEGQSENIGRDERSARYSKVKEKRILLMQAMRRDLDIPGQSVGGMLNAKRRQVSKS